MPNTVTYMNGRKKYARPQAMIWSENDKLTSVTAQIIPEGSEVGAETLDAAGEFLILSDHNRSPITITAKRLEGRDRMINGNMRSFHIADKIQISVSWEMLPSRRYSEDPSFNNSGANQIPSFDPAVDQFVVDGGAGGSDLLDWYENHTGSFFVFLSYDKPSNFDPENNPYQHLNEYSEVVEVFVSDFSYEVVRRGATNYDFWNVSVTLEQV